MVTSKQQNLNRKRSKVPKTVSRRAVASLPIGAPKAINDGDPPLKVCEVDRWTNEGGAINQTAVSAAPRETIKSDRAHLSDAATC